MCKVHYCTLVLLKSLISLFVVLKEPFCEYTRLLVWRSGWGGEGLSGGGKSWAASPKILLKAATLSSTIEVVASLKKLACTLKIVNSFWLSLKHTYICRQRVILLHICMLRTYIQLCSNTSSITYMWLCSITLSRKKVEFESFRQKCWHYLIQNAKTL